MYVRMNTCLHTLNNSTITLQYFYDFLSLLHIAQCAITSRATGLPYTIEAMRCLKMCACGVATYIYTLQSFAIQTATQKTIQPNLNSNLMSEVATNVCNS